ncbi:MAG: hypothetical protein Q4D79_07810 [Propionibacteriaceae bacterium]|nr:hypothetical protein [Propionibacteriaceae bacterium]
MSPGQKLTRGGAKAVVQRMVEITEGRPALKLDVTETNVTLTVLTVDDQPMTLRWHDNKIDQVDSDVQYLGQSTFRPADYPLGNVGELFETAQKLGAEGSEKVLQIVEYRRGEVFMTVSTRPETKTVFFEKDGAALRNLGFTSVADLTEGLAAVIGGSRATTQVGFAPEIGYWTDLPPSNGVVERRTRSSALPVYLTRRNETTDLAPFDPTQVDALVLARVIAKYNTGDNQGCRVEIDNRFKRETPIARYDCAGKIYYTDLAGTEYTEQELKS